jgi:hypothetical protein
MNHRYKKAGRLRQPGWLLLIGLLPVAPQAADRPDWAFPVAAFDGLG